jgi:hypothetical protein
MIGNAHTTTSTIATASATTVRMVERFTAVS